MKKILCMEKLEDIIVKFLDNLTFKLKQFSCVHNWKLIKTNPLYYKCRHCEMEIKE